MPLVPIILEKGFRDIMDHPPKSHIETARKMASVYADYTRSAVAGVSGPILLTGTEAPRMAGVLATGFNPLGGHPAAISAIVRGITSFWLAPPVPFTAGVVVSWGGGPVLVACLSSSFINPKVTTGQAAKTLADCFDAATRLVLVQSVAPGPPVPIT